MTHRAPSRSPCPNCPFTHLGRLAQFDQKQVKLTLKAVNAGRRLLRHLDQAQLFWKHEEVAELHRALEAGEIFVEDDLAILAAIKDRVWYFLTDKVPAYEPILRQGSTRKHPFVDPVLEHARLLWEGLYCFQTLRQAALDHRRAVRATLNGD